MHPCPELVHGCIEKLDEEIGVINGNRLKVTISVASIRDMLCNPTNWEAKRFHHQRMGDLCATMDR